MRKRQSPLAQKKDSKKQFLPPLTKTPVASLAYTAAPLLKEEFQESKNETASSSLLLALALPILTGLGYFMWNNPTVQSSAADTHPQLNNQNLETLIIQLDSRDHDPNEETRLREQLKNGVVPAELHGASDEILNAFKNEEMELYRVSVSDFLDEDGDMIQVDINNIPYKRISLVHDEQSIPMPVYKNKPQTIKITALKDGKGGVTVGLRTHQGEIQTNVLEVGKSQVFYGRMVKVK